MGHRFATFAAASEDPFQTASDSLQGGGPPHGMPESIVMDCAIRNLSIPTRTATKVQGRLIR